MANKFLKDLRASMEDYNGMDGVFWRSPEDETAGEGVDTETLEDIADAFDGDIVAVGDTVAIAEDDIEDVIEDIDEAEELIDDVEEAVEETNDLADDLDCGVCSVESAEVMNNVMETIAKNRALISKQLFGFSRKDMRTKGYKLIPSMESLQENPSSKLRASTEGLVSVINSVWGKIVDMQNNLSVSLGSWLSSFGAYVKYAGDLDNILLSLKDQIDVAAAAAAAKTGDDIAAGLSEDAKEATIGSSPEMFYLAPTDIPLFNADFAETVIEAHDTALAAAYDTVLAKISGEADTENQLVIESLLDNSGIDYDTINKAAREVLSRSFITLSSDVGNVPAGSIVTRRAVYKSTSFNDTGIEPITSVLDDAVTQADVTPEAATIVHANVIDQLSKFGETGKLFGLTPGGLQQFVKDGYNLLTDGAKDKLNTLQTLVISINPVDRSKIGNLPGEISFLKNEVFNNIADEYDSQLAAAKPYDIELTDENKVYATTITKGGLAFTDRSLISADDPNSVSGITLKVGGNDCLFTNTKDVLGWASNVSNAFELAGFNKSAASLQTLVTTLTGNREENTLTCISDLRNLLISLVELASPVCGSIALSITKFNPSLAILTVAEAVISAIKQLVDGVEVVESVVPADGSIADTDSVTELMSAPAAAAVATEVVDPVVDTAVADVVAENPVEEIIEEELSVASADAPKVVKKVVVVKKTTNATTEDKKAK